MKAFLFTVASVLAFASGVKAQSILYSSNLPPDYNWEVGANFGLSVPTRPVGPAESYVGRSTRIVHDYSVRLNYFFTPHWMLSVDLGDRRWESKTTWIPNDLHGQTLKPREVNFLIADHAINECVGINYVIPFYTKYNTFNRANVYFGTNVGMVQTLNDGSTKYSRYNAPPDSFYTYVSRYDYGSGTGFTFGAQVGFTFYIVPRLGVNLDLAARYVTMHTTDVNYRAENSTVTLLYFPETLGIRWRF